jgi:hypothetical protein
VPDPEHDTGHVLPAVVLAFEVVGEESLLQGDATVGVEVDPVGVTVDLQPLVRRGSLGEGLHVASEMKAVASPVPRREQRRDDPRPIRVALEVPIID